MKLTDDDILLYCHYWLVAHLISCKVLLVTRNIALACSLLEIDAQWKLSGGCHWWPRGNGEREGGKASEKPNQQLLLIMDIHMVEEPVGKQAFSGYFPKEFVKNNKI